MSHASFRLLVTIAMDGEEIESGSREYIHLCSMAMPVAPRVGDTIILKCLVDEQLKPPTEHQLTCSSCRDVEERGYRVTEVQWEVDQFMYGEKGKREWNGIHGDFLGRVRVRVEQTYPREEE